MYWLPKLHKTPYKARFIANSSSCTTTELSKLLTSCLTAVKNHVIRYCEKVYERSETTWLWPLIHVQNACLLNILRMNRRISIKFCICIDIYIWSSFIQLHFAFPYFSTELRPLIYVRNVFLPNIFKINGYISRKFSSFVIEV